MKYFYLMLLCTTTLCADPVCHRCEVIREHNKENPGDFEFYEDYLKCQEEKKTAPTAGVPSPK